MIAISSAVRGRQLNLACGPFLVSFLHRCMSMKDSNLVQGVIFKSYFKQFKTLDKVEHQRNTKVSNL